MTPWHASSRRRTCAGSLKAAGVDTRFLLFLEYPDALKYVSEHSQDKVIFMDNGASAPSRVIQALFGMLTPAPGGSAPTDAEGSPTPV